MLQQTPDKEYEDEFSGDGPYRSPGSVQIALLKTPYQELQEYKKLIKVVDEHYAEWLNFFKKHYKDLGLFISHNAPYEDGDELILYFFRNTFYVQEKSEVFYVSPDYLPICSVSETGLNLKQKITLLQNIHHLLDKAEKEVREKVLYLEEEVMSITKPPRWTAKEV